MVAISTVISNNYTSQDFIRYRRMIEGRQAETDEEDGDDNLDEAGSSEEAKERRAWAYPRADATDNIRDIARDGEGLFTQLHQGKCKMATLH